jgi:hypothetical protein
MKKTILIALALASAALLGGRAQATIVSTVPAYGASIFIAAPPSGSVTVLKALQVSNDTASNACAYLYASANIDSSKSNMKLTVCAPAGQTVYWPSGNAAAMQNSGISGAASAFFGELLKLTGIVSINTALTASGTVDSTKSVGQVSASYVYQPLR